MIVSYSEICKHDKHDDILFSQSDTTSVNILILSQIIILQNNYILYGLVKNS